MIRATLRRAKPARLALPFPGCSPVPRSPLAWHSPGSALRRRGSCSLIWQFCLLALVATLVVFSSLGVARAAAPAFTDQFITARVYMNCGPGTSVPNLLADPAFPEAEPLLREGLAMRKRLLGAEHPAVAESLGDLAGVLERQDRLAEAEAACREALALRERTLSGDWLTFDARCRLGAILVDKKNFAEAEPLLLSGYAAMKEHVATIPIPKKARLKEAIQSIARLYEAANRPDQAAKWKKKAEAGQ